MPGSLVGRINSPIPDLGPDPKTLISFEILKIDEAVVLRAP